MNKAPRSVVAWRVALAFMLLFLVMEVVSGVDGTAIADSTSSVVRAVLVFSAVAAVLLAGTLLVGFNEEVVSRRLIVVGLRGCAVRRVTGTIIASTVIHGVWDFPTFVHEGSDLAANAVATRLGSIAQGWALYAAVIPLVVGAHGLFAGAGHTPPRTRPATAA